MNMENFVKEYLVELDAVVKRVSQDDIQKVMALLFDAWSYSLSIISLKIMNHTAPHVR